MLDVVAIAMIGIVLVLAYSIYVVRCRKNYRLHRKIQVMLGVVLLVTVGLFELDIRLYGWRQFAEASVYYDSWVFPSLYIHLVFAISTTLLWIYTIAAALKRFDNPPVPNAYSPRHRRIATLAAIDMFCTAITGWIFYMLAFVA